MGYSMNKESSANKHIHRPRGDDLRRIIDLIPNLRSPVTKESAAHALYALAEKLLQSPKRFNSIFVDHTSGHMTGVFVERILSLKYGEHVPMHMHDLSKKKILEEPEIISNELQRKVASGELRGLVLVATEAIASGRAMSFLFKELERLGIDYKFVTLSEETGAFVRKKEFAEKRIFSCQDPFVISALSEKSPVTSRVGSAYARPDKNKKSEHDADTYSKVCLLADELYAQVHRAMKK